MAAASSSANGSTERREKTPERETPAEYPAEFEQNVVRFRAFHDIAEWVVDSLGSFIRVMEPVPHNPPQTTQCELKQMSDVCGKVAQNQLFEEYSLLPMISTISDVTMNIARRENYTNQESFDRVWKPLKSWVDEDYPRISRELKKCFELHADMTSAIADAQRKPIPAKASKAEKLKEQHEKQFKLCQKELDLMKMVHKHQQTCLKLLLDLQYGFHTFCEKELEQACTAMAKIHDKLSKEDV